MKKIFLIIALAAALSARADTITFWNFNDVPFDAFTSTGSTNPATGSGILRVIGGAVYTFATGSTNDPATTNSAINVSSYPASAAANKTAGIRFAVNTAAYTNITVSWLQRASATGSRYHRVQYSTNGTDFIDMPSAFAISYPDSATASLVFTNQTADLSTIPGVADNPNFAFQIVSEWASTAAGGAANYVAASTGSTYSTSGTARFDLMTISGTVAGVINTSPTISAITNVTMRADSSYPAIPFTIGDAETTATALTVDKSSSNPALLPLSGVVLDGLDSNRTVVLTPAPGQLGSSLITLTVIDGGGKSNSTVFLVTVIPTNTTPSISAIDNQGTVASTPTPAISFTIGDAETAVGALTVNAYSSNTVVLPQSGVVLGGSASNRTITLTPAVGQTGNALVRISVSDGVLTTNRTFVLSALPSSGTLFYEPFDYADGSLVTNSLGLWRNHGGTNGSLTVVNKEAFISASYTEDANGLLRGEPYAVATGTNLYYSLNFSAENLPTVEGGYFAHFISSGNAFRGRLIASTVNAPIFYYRIGVGNGINSATNSGYAEIPINLTFGESNLVVVRYNVGTGRTTLWLNPTDQSSPNVTATDVLGSTNAVSQFALRQSAFAGDLYVDNIRVTTTFNEALGILPQPNVSLKIFRSGVDAVVSWPTAATGFTLQSCDNLTTTNWQNVLTAPTVVGSENFVTNVSPTGDAFFRLKN